MEALNGLRIKLFGDVGTVFIVSLAIIASFVVTAAVAPADVERIATIVLDATANKFGWIYLLVTTGFVLFTLFLAVSRFGNICLGPADEAPEF